MKVFKNRFINIVVSMICCLMLVCSLSVGITMTASAKSTLKAEMLTYYPDAKDTSKWFKYFLLPDVNKNDEGCLFVVNASPQYGKCLEIPDAIDGKKITCVKVMEANRFEEAVLGDNVESMECLFPIEDASKYLNQGIANTEPENTIKKITVGKNFLAYDLAADSACWDVRMKIEAEREKNFNIHGYFPNANLMTVRYTNLEEVIVPKENKNFEIYESGIYVDGRQKLVGCLKDAKNSELDLVCTPECKYVEVDFEEYDYVKSITFGRDFKEIIDYSLDDCSIEKISFENCPNYVPDGFNFMACSNLKNLIMPANLTKIPKDLLSGCKQLEKIILPEKLEELEFGAFVGCVKLTEIVAPENLEIDQETLLFGEYKTVKLPKGTEKIDSFAFSDNSSIETLDIPEGVKSIGWHAFYNCNKLREVKLPASLEWSDESVFEQCTSLEKIELPASITEVKFRMFWGCTSLSEFSALGTVKEVQAMAFQDCDSLKKISFAEGLDSIQWEAFENCDSLKYVTLPESLDSVGKKAFNNCKKLKRITIKGKKTKLEKLAVGKHMAKNGKRMTNKKLVIVAPKGSLAQKYAKKNKIKFKVLK